ncbi:5'-nucleotidase/2',3'-cyclic phosphodiesterase-like hydrolase [Corynebacterium epidermidicanis]|uniref:5'-nucleotidase/2',3'-cyclic phosphodiesterase-like hydrolase n=2 Tax=Corynebacterium epidermidicanis TaxID=1050174 RepID=A0A0G3GQ35_9CORY|nr:5'-nucleotidase/2',3'-cyclic phosphodiesterase-like hydrolase [Corynebacterium epidermidicanis]
MTPAAHAQSAPVEFNIAGITDFHGHISKQAAKDGKVLEPGAAMLACMLPKAADGKPQLFVSSGDNIGGSAFNSALLKDEPTLRALNAMGLVASAVGNHEFDAGYADLAGRVTDIAEFPYLGANVYGESPDLPAYSIQEVNDVKVAFVGTVTETTKDKVSPAGIVGIDFGEPNAATNEAAKKLKESGEADVVVALIHEGFRTPEMFNEFVDIAMAGDSHLIDNQVITRKDGSKFALVQAGHYGKGLADLDITFDPTSKKITNIASKVYSTDEIAAACAATPDAQVAALVADAESKAAEEGNKEVAQLTSDFYRGSNNGTVKEAGSNRGVESTISNMIAEAAKQGIANTTSVKPDLGVMNPGGVRADLLKGAVTYAEAFAAQPFGNEISYTTLTGADIVQVLEQQWRPDNAERPMLALGWSDNLTYTYDPDAPQGKRVTSVLIDGKPIDLTKNYIVAGSTFLLQGGDGFSALGNEKTVLPNTGQMDVQVLIDYLEANKDLAPRASQNGVGVHLESTPTAGKPLKIDLSSLIYTVGDPAKTVTVKLGDVEETANIDPAYEAGLPGAGKATVELTVPQDIESPATLVITTDAGTKVELPIEIEAAVKKPAGSTSGSTTGSTGSSTSSAGSSLGGGILALFGLTAVIVGMFHHLNPALIANFMNHAACASSRCLEAVNSLLMLDWVY